jgi:hypothetical protein
LLAVSIMTDSENNNELILAYQAQVRRIKLNKNQKLIVFFSS